jgi:hypothetical protein
LPLSAGFPKFFFAKSVFFYDFLPKPKKVLKSTSKKQLAPKLKIHSNGLPKQPNLFATAPSA